MTTQELIDQEAKKYSQEKNDIRFRHLEFSRQEILKEYIEDDFIAGTKSNVFEMTKINLQVEMINTFIDDINFACNIDGLEQFSDAYYELVNTLNNRKTNLNNKIIELKEKI